jgi:hypothetical protein
MSQSAAITVTVEDMKRKCLGYFYPLRLLQAGNKLAAAEVRVDLIGL